MEMTEIKHERTVENTVAPGGRNRRHEEDERGWDGQWAQPRIRQGRGEISDKTSGQWAAISAGTRADSRGLPVAGA